MSVHDLLAARARPQSCTAAQKLMRDSSQEATLDSVIDCARAAPTPSKNLGGRTEIMHYSVFFGDNFRLVCGFVDNLRIVWGFEDLVTIWL